MSRCEVCEKPKADDGILICPTCSLTGALSQSAWVTPATAGDPTSRPYSLQRAVVRRPGGRNTTVKQEREVLYRDRGRYEVKVLVIDLRAKRQRESWLHRPSGEEHRKDVPLTGAPSLHGKASCALFTVRRHPPQP